MSLLRFRSASTASDTTEHERDRAAASDDIMDPAATYAVIIALFLAAGVLEIGARPRGNQNSTTPSTRIIKFDINGGRRVGTSPILDKANLEAAPGSAAKCGM